jgi:hypothetical protein
MSNGRKALVAFLLIAGILLIADTLIQNVAVYLPIGLAVLLYGLFWLCAE